MKVAELRQLAADDLQEKLVSLKKELYQLRVISQTSRVERPSDFNHIKKDVARILTVLKELKDESAKNSK